MEKVVKKLLKEIRFGCAVLEGRMYCALQAGDGVEGQVKNLVDMLAELDDMALDLDRFAKDDDEECGWSTVVEQQF